MPPRSSLFSFLLVFAVGLTAAPVWSVSSARAQSDGTATGTQTGADGATLAVTIDGLQADLGGRVYIGLYNTGARFPERNAQVRQARADVEGPQARVVFEDLPRGRYAIAAFHDENGDAMFNQGLFGVPLEGFGFSNDAEVLFGSPSFDDAAFAVQGPETTHTFRIRYGL
jgi:uncharacterized protein (DUF2141 family)